MALKTRLKSLEDAALKADGGPKVAFIAYDPIERSKAEAVAEWESKNGPIEGCHVIFFTAYEPQPVPLPETLIRT